MPCPNHVCLCCTLKKGGKECTKWSLDLQNSHRKSYLIPPIFFLFFTSKESCISTAEDSDFTNFLYSFRNNSFKRAVSYLYILYLVVNPCWCRSVKSTNSCELWKGPFSDRSQPSGPVEPLKPAPVGSAALAPTVNQLWSRLRVNHCHRNMKAASLMEMHGPLMLLPPAPVTPHSHRTADESCWREGGGWGSERKTEARRTKRAINQIFLSASEW